MRPRYDRAVHSVAILPETPLTAFLDRAELGVNSYHHQALDKLGDGFQAIAWGESNGHTFTEAIQHESLPIWSVQWHPERMTGPVTNPKECVDSLPMFEYFVKQCAK